MEVYDKRPAVPDIGAVREVPGVKSNSGLTGIATPQPVTDLSMIAGRLELLVSALLEASGNIGGALLRLDNSAPINDTVIPERPDSALGRVYSLIDLAEYEAGLLRLQSDRISSIA